MKYPSAIIFDMDGVIVDSEPRHEQAFRDIFEEMGYGSSHGMHFPDYYGRSDRALWVDFIAKHQPVETLEDLLSRKEKRLIDIIRREEPIFETLPELVSKLADRYPLAVASGSMHPVIDTVLAMKGLRRFFGPVVSVQDVTRGKPAPDVFLRAADLLKVEPGDCCVIEDSAAGVEAGRSAGMQVIAITNTLKADQLTRAHHIVQHYYEIEAILLPHTQS